MSNLVYIAASIDGYIADRNNKLDWLQMVPNPDNSDFGYAAFLDGIDAIVMGRNTYEMVVSFGGDWPYSKPVFVLSHSLKLFPEKLQGKVNLIKGTPGEITNTLNNQGFENLYIDGGYTIQSFLEANLIDELIITRIPVLLGGGIPLFGKLSEHRKFKHISTEVLLGEMVVSRFRRSN